MQINHLILNIRLACSARYEQLVVHANICVCVSRAAGPDKLTLRVLKASSWQSFSTLQQQVQLNHPLLYQFLKKETQSQQITSELQRLVILRFIKAALTLCSLSQTPKQIRG